MFPVPKQTFEKCYSVSFVFSRSTMQVLVDHNICLHYTSESEKNSPSHSSYIAVAETDGYLVVASWPARRWVEA